jgi:nitrate reductase NapD
LAEELHIASMVVHSTPRRLPSVEAALRALPGCLVHAASARGKLVITLEAPGADEMTQSVSSIQRIDGVLSAALVYQCADLLEIMNEEMPDA